jgi:hypothetical protein
MKKMKTSYKGRKCQFPHCKHILSIYNHETFCHVHQGEGGQQRLRSKKG